MPACLLRAKRCRPKRLSAPIQSEDGILAAQWRSEVYLLVPDDRCGATLAWQCHLPQDVRYVPFDRIRPRFVAAVIAWTAPARPLVGTFNRSISDEQKQHWQ